MMYADELHAKAAQLTARYDMPEHQVFASTNYMIGIAGYSVVILQGENARICYTGNTPENVLAELDEWLQSEYEVKPLVPLGF